MKTKCGSSGQVPSTGPGTLEVFSVGYGQRIQSFTNSFLMLPNALLGAGDTTMDLTQMRLLLLGSLQMNSTHVNS